MKKFLKLLVCGLLGGAVLFSATACAPEDPENPNNNGTQKYDPETRALSLSIGALDGNFNPFYSTSLTDAQVISMTQASLITSSVDENGAVQPVAGENYPTIAKDFEIKYYNAPTGGSEVDSSVAANGGRTEYRFLIKNGMKFSDGEPLTIKDVLFNFYVYLDPVYTGSNTMYSVDIQGLKAYQSNDATLNDDDDSASGAYVALAQERLQALIGYGAKDPDYSTLDTQGQKDFERVKELYKEELESDWSAMETSWVETYKVNYTFKAAWQAYLFQEGIVTAQIRKYSDGSRREIRVDDNGNEILIPVDKDTDSAEYKAAMEKYNNGKTKTTLDPWVEGADGGDGSSTLRQNEIDEIAAETSDANVNAYMSAHNCDRDTAILQITKEYCVDRVYRENLNDDGTGLDNVLQYWATGTNAYNEFLADARGKALEDSDNPMYYIKGIQTERVSTFKGKALDADYDVLKIIVNEVDPAAIWQFGITVAPMHYYSGKYDNVDYIAKFNGDQNNGKGSGDANTCFGVKRGDFDFFNEVVKGVNEGKSGVPVGAGPYMASKRTGGAAQNGGEFEENYIVYYERNSYFETMGSEINNAKIRFLRYKVLAEDRILSSIQSGDIDYGEPNATDTNYTAVTNQSNLQSVVYDTNGYGYVGINPTFVKDIEIRKIIMHAMNQGLSLSYYGDLAQPIYRPMSMTSWAYPKDATEKYYEDWDSNKIKEKLAELKYVEGNDGVYSKNGERLEYTFTIAGANSDHPAYNMFQDAASLLNRSGFKIKVSTDPNALLALTRGGLAVWAAAWSSGVDPDMYQVYHKDSQATSVLNWGYRTILNDVTGEYTEEANLINSLSLKIDEARATTVQVTRANLYKECLNYIMELAVELPIYQRKDLCVFNKTIIDSTTVNGNPTANNGVMDRIWEVNYL